MGKGKLRQCIPRVHQEEIMVPCDANILLPSRDGSKPLLHSACLGSLLLEGCRGERTGSEKLWGLGIGSQVERLE